MNPVEGARTVRRLKTGFLLLLVLGAAACWPRPVPEVLKIGLSAPFEGRYRAIGYDTIYAARLAVREINERGALPGHRLALVAYDDRADVAMARSNAEALVTDPAVVAVIGHYRSRTTEAAAPVYREGGVPMVAVGGWLTPTVSGVWHLAPSPDRVCDALLGQASETSTTSVTLFGGDASQAGLGRAMDRAPGGTLPRLARPSGEGGLPPADAVVSLAEPHETAEALRVWRAAGWDGRLVGTTDLGASSFRQIAGDAASGARFVTPYPLPQDLQDTDTWIKAYRDVGPHVPAPSYYALPTYEAVYTLADAVAAAIEAGMDPGREGVMAMLPDVSLAGWLGTITWDRDDYWAEAPLYLYAWGAEGELGPPQRLNRDP